MVSIKKIFGSHDHAGDDGGDLRHAPSGGSLKNSTGKESEAKTKNDELASRIGNSSSDNTDGAERRKSLTNSSNNTGLTSSNSPRHSTSNNRDSTTGYNTEPAAGKGEYNQGLDNVGSHRGLVGNTTPHHHDANAPVVEVLAKETVPGTSNVASDHILQTHRTHAGTVDDNTPRIPVGTANNNTSTSTPVAANVTSDKTGHGRLSSSSSGRGFDNPHETGHVASKTLQEFDPKLATHDHQHLQHVVHKDVRHVEIEEVERQREVDRHIHHVQTHIQPVLDKKVLPEKISENIIEPTKVHETHSSTQEDVALFQQLATQHRDTETHRAKERTVVDLGEKVTEKVTHHVHHVTQPIIEQEIVERHRIHTVIPVHHVTHEAPIIHKSSTHAPVSLDDFLQGGGKLDSKVTAQTSGLLADDECERSVDGVAEKLISDLGISGSVYGHSHSHGASGSDGKYVSNDGDRHSSKIATTVDNATPSNNRVGTTDKI